MVFEIFSEKWHRWTYTEADPRTRNRPLMGSPSTAVAICIFYVVLIKIILVKVMGTRKAFNTRFLSLALNSYLLATACYFFVKSCSIGWFTKYSWRCEPLDPTSSEDAIEVNFCKVLRTFIQLEISFQVVDTIYAFLIVKFTYMLETVVFMLGKKDVLVSKYHVFHHATLPMLIWLAVNYYPGGHAMFFGLINSITHMIVLAYFVAVTALPGLKKYTTWWKSAFNWLHVRSTRVCETSPKLFQDRSLSDWTIHRNYFAYRTANLLEPLRLSDEAFVLRHDLRCLSFRFIFVVMAVIR